MSATASILSPGTLYRDDNVEVLASLPAESVDLVYLDPPFFSNRNYEVIWGDEAEIRSFQDRWEGGVGVYADWMQLRIEQIHRVLKPTGSMYLHCDWHASHYIKVMCDEVFTYRQFQNEIVWFYRGAGVSPKRWGRRHDTLLFYTKGKEWTFNVDPVRVPYAESTEARFRHYVGNVRQGQDFGPQGLKAGGKHPDDVWTIPIVAPSARARLGYPTQKPEALLRNVILASSNKGDLVLDPFCGCGTALAVAQQVGRKWIGIDISPKAVEICDWRLRTLGALPIQVGMPRSGDDLLKLGPFEFQNWILTQMQAVPSPRKTGDRGIDGRMILTHDPVQVKQGQIGRPHVDAFETAIKRAGHGRGFMVGFRVSRDAREEASRCKRREGIEIIFYTVNQLLAGAPTERILKLVKDKDYQLTLDDAVLPFRAPSELPSAEELVSSERQRIVAASG